MNLISKLLTFGTLAATSLAAHASPIVGSISGNDNGAFYNNATGTLMFGNPGSVSGTPIGLGGYFSMNEVMTFYPNSQTGSMGFFFYSPVVGTTLTVAGSTATTGGVEVFSVTSSGNNPETLSFYVTSDTTQYAPTDNSSVVIAGSGYFMETGAVNYDPTAASFHLSGTDTGNTFSFGGSATAISATPEPSSLMLLGTGLVSAAGMVLRKRRSVV